MGPRPDVLGGAVALEGDAEAGPAGPAAPRHDGALVARPAHELHLDARADGRRRLPDRELQPLRAAARHPPRRPWGGLVRHEIVHVVDGPEVLRRVYRLLNSSSEKTRSPAAACGLWPSTKYSSPRSLQWNTMM